MKPLVLILLALLCSVQITQGQVIESSTTTSAMTESPQDMYDFYIERNKKLKKTGYILLASGGGAVLTGILIAATSNTWSGVGSGALIMTAGIGSTLASIPVFLVADSKKRKAELILETGNLGVQGLPLLNSGYAAAGIKISF